MKRFVCFVIFMLFVVYFDLVRLIIMLYINPRSTGKNAKIVRSDIETGFEL
jgi:hypothetical protein